MLTISIFVVYVALFAFLYNYTQSYRLQKLLSSTEPSKLAHSLMDVLIPAGVPWFIFILTGLIWGFSSPPSWARVFRVDEEEVLFVVAGLGLGLSYTVLFQAGRLAGYRDGQFQARSHFPQFVREDSGANPVEIRGWVRHDDALVVGDELMYHHRRFRVTSMIDEGKDFKFIVALHQTSDDS